MLSILLKRSMPELQGKRVEPVSAKINAKRKELLQVVCGKEDRSMSYVITELAMRGLALYKQDGLLKITEDEEKIITNSNKKGAPVIDIGREKTQKKKAG